MKFIEVGVTNLETRWVNLSNVVEVYAAADGSSLLRFVDGTILAASHNYEGLIALILATV